MVVTEEINYEDFEPVNLDAITESSEGDCLFYITCSAKLREQIGEKYAAIQNLFGFPKFGSC